jgi:hypothetical protein
MKDSTNSNPTALFLNTHEPFCLVAVGVQGGGKSHTLACALEACLVPAAPVVRLRGPMSALVLHYDQSPASVCEATGLIHSKIAGLYAEAAAAAGAGAGAGAAEEERPPTPAPALPKEKLVVLVSPSYFRQRSRFYGDYCTVKPLLLEWSTLSADHIKKLMRVKDGDTQLYMAAMLDLLRRYQRLAQAPAFNDFVGYAYLYRTPEIDLS